MPKNSRKATKNGNAGNGTRKLTQAEKFSLAKAAKNAAKATNAAKAAANAAIRAANAAKTSEEKRAEAAARLLAKKKANAKFIKSYTSGASERVRQFEAFAKTVERESNAIHRF